MNTEARWCANPGEENGHVPRVIHLQAREHQGLDGKGQTLGRGKEDFPFKLQRECGPADTLIFDN